MIENGKVVSHGTAGSGTPKPARPPTMRMRKWPYIRSRLKTASADRSLVAAIPAAAETFPADCRSPETRQRDFCCPYGERPLLRSPDGSRWSGPDRGLRRSAFIDKRVG